MDTILVVCGILLAIIAIIAILYAIHLERKVARVNIYNMIFEYMLDHSGLTEEELDALCREADFVIIKGGDNNGKK